MCDKSYETYVLQKYRLAVALSVIKSKPENLTIDQYVEQIKTKLTERAHNSENDDISLVNSEDFDMSNNEVTNYESEIRDQTDMLVGLENTCRVRLDTQIITEEQSKEDYNKLQSYGFRNDASNLDFAVSIANISKIIASDNKGQTHEFETQVLNDATATNLDSTMSIDSISKNIATDNKGHNYEFETQVLDESLNILEDFNDPLVGVLEEAETSQALTEVLTIIKSFDMEMYDLKHHLKSTEPVSVSKYANIDQHMKINENDAQMDNTVIDSQTTIPYTYTNTENHISQSQAENVVIDKQYIILKVSKDNRNETVGINKDLLRIVPNDHSVRQENRKLINNEDFKGNGLGIYNLDNASNDVGTDETRLNEDLEEDAQDEISKCILPSAALQETLQTEVIPFKIIEEMSKLKTLLSKRDRKMSTDGYSTDSGYRSDSQKSFRSSLHLTDNWLNQSGCSLLRHLADCPLATSTHEINDEIAQVLGKLIDRLQEDEKCPTFLEEILENVDLLLKNIHEGSSGEETALTDKDESIHRLLLFNKSIHIQKYTISKIITILERIHQKFTSTEFIYELENIDRVENLCYVLHVLEILLQKYVKYKNNSQNSQSSQNEEKFPKRSTITDIWRRKWNYAAKEILENEGSCEKVCVLTKCRDVLNKMIVDCMNGYSLVAFAALQCFNLLQS